MAIPEGYKANFSTLKQAFANDDVVLMECSDVVTGKPVYTICAVGKDGDQFVFAPFAKMFDGNPYEELNPPMKQEAGPAASLILTP